MERLQCTRASWAIRIDSALVDKFFNGRMGIRAQYYLSPYHGRHMNSLLLSALHEQLTGFAVDADPLVDRTLVSQSITEPSAKAWISATNLAGEKIIPCV